MIKGIETYVSKILNFLLPQFSFFNQIRIIEEELPTEKNEEEKERVIEEKIEIKPPTPTKKENEPIIMLLKFNTDSYDDSEFRKAIESSIFTQKEKDRINRIRYSNEMASKRSVSMQLIAKKTLAELHGLNIKEVEITRTKDNKPFWENFNPELFPCLNFNISHSGSYGIIGFVSHGVIGVDVQTFDFRNKPRKQNLTRLQRIKNSFSFREFHFICKLKYPTNEVNDKEKADLDYYLTQLSNAELADIFERFYYIWVLKEAFVKAIGFGLKFGLTRIEFIYNDNEIKTNKDFLTAIPSLYVDSKKTDDWIFKSVRIDEDHIAGFGYGSINSEYISESFKKTLSFNTLDTEKIERKREKIIQRVESMNFGFEDVYRPIEEDEIDFYSQIN